MLYRDLVDYIDEYEHNEDLGELLYHEALSRLARPTSDLAKLNEDDVVLVIKPYLIYWGGMSRVMGRKNLDWSRLTRTLKKLEPEFAKFRKLNFLDLDFTDPEECNSIKKIFQNIDKIPYIGGPTGVSKIIHLVNPKVFVMWDEAIVKKYHDRFGKITNSAEGYLRFLKKAKDRIEKAFTDQANLTGKPKLKVIEEFKQRYSNKTIAKLIDEFNMGCPMSYL